MPFAVLFLFGILSVLFWVDSLVSELWHIRRHSLTMSNCTSEAKGYLSFLCYMPRTQILCTISCFRQHAPQPRALTWPAPLISLVRQTSLYNCAHGVILRCTSLHFFKVTIITLFLLDSDVALQVKRPSLIMVQTRPSEGDRAAVLRQIPKCREHLTNRWHTWWMWVFHVRYSSTMALKKLQQFNLCVAHHTTQLHSRFDTASGIGWKNSHQRAVICKLRRRIAFVRKHRRKLVLSKILK